MGSTKTTLTKFLPGHRSPDMSPEQQSGALRDIEGAIEAGDRSKNAVSVIYPWVLPEFSVLTERAKAEADAALAATLQSSGPIEGKAAGQPEVSNLERIRQDVADRAVPASEMMNA